MRSSIQSSHQDTPSNVDIKTVKSPGYEVFLINSKVLDARRRGATTEAYGAIRRKPVESLKVEREERSKATLPFGFSQGRESFDFAQDREPAERPVERQMMP
jgi:hypothetical protein